MAYPELVKIVEVGPRDGLQNEAQNVSVATRIELIDRLSDAGLKSIEVGAFVSPQWVPQMSDTDKVFQGIQKKAGVSYPALVPNMQGFEAALVAGIREIAVFAAASEGFSQKNIHCSIAESLERFASVCAAAEKEGIRVRGYISCVIACPYDGETDPQRVADVARALHDLGCYEISLGDTIGVGTPLKIQKMIRAVAQQVSVGKLAAHYHDTYGQALANVLISLQEGITVVDSAVGGLGGCPYAKGAKGNIATEDLLFMLNGMGIQTGVDMEKLVAAGRFITGTLGKKPASKVLLARS